MTNKERMKNVLDAIMSVRRDATKARDSGDLIVFSNKMLDLFALENCLVTEALNFFETDEENYKKAA